MDGAHRRTLERALDIVGDKERLAAAIGVEVEQLDDYLEGEEPLPHQAFLHALDVVAKTPRG